ncbi:MAG: CGNR zinc finger domain-containing protein [Mycobacteriales bacterium]
MKGVKVVFAHDTEAALVAAAELVNTELIDLDALDDLLSAHRYTGSRARDDNELTSVLSLQPRLRALWEAAPDVLVAEVNELLRTGGALPQLVAHDGWGPHLHATPADAPLADRLAVEAAMALVDVVRSDELARLQVCAADDCSDVLVDLSKNRSRRYCSTACANRVNVAAFRARQREG